MPVKGKGEMETFFVRGRAPSRFRRPNEGSSQNRKSLAAVVFGMVQARRRQTIRGAKGKTRKFISLSKLAHVLPKAMSFFTP